MGLFPSIFPGFALLGFGDSGLSQGVLTRSGCCHFGEHILELTFHTSLSSYHSGNSLRRVTKIINARFCFSLVFIFISVLLIFPLVAMAIHI